MGFLSLLEGVMKDVPGAVACTVMGYDGISVETHQSPEAAAAEELELSATWVEYANVLTQLKSAAEMLKTGSVTEVSINTERLITLMRMVSPEYFLVLALKPEGNYGKARYVLRVTAPKVKAEL